MKVTETDEFITDVEHLLDDEHRIDPPAVLRILGFHVALRVVDDAIQATGPQHLEYGAIQPVAGFCIEVVHVPEREHHVHAGFAELEVVEHVITASLRPADVGIGLNDLNLLEAGFGEYALGEGIGAKSYIELAILGENRCENPRVPAAPGK